MHIYWVPIFVILHDKLTATWYPAANSYFLLAHNIRKVPYLTIYGMASDATCIWWLGTWTLNFILIVETLWHSNVSVEYCKLLCLCPMPSIVSIGILSSPSNTSEINFYVYLLSEFFPFLCVFCDKSLPAIEICSRYKSSKSFVCVAILQQWN